MCISAVAALSTQLSTAALDKNPQSKERGITLDLGFSSFSLPLPESLAALQADRLQFTLVDCPGHASLIRTVIGGAQIIDLMILVVDVTKGIQVRASTGRVMSKCSQGQATFAARCVSGCGSLLGGPLCLPPASSSASAAATEEAASWHRRRRRRSAWWWARSRRSACWSC